MTNEEAIKILEVAKTAVEWIAPLEYQVAFDMAIKALEKQIPKKPKMPLDEYWVCPMCGRKVEYIYLYGHCMSCGQVIDWSEKNDTGRSD